MTTASIHFYVRASRFVVNACFPIALAILPMLPELRRDAKTEKNALSTEFSSAYTVLDLIGTKKLLKKHKLLP